MVFGPGFESYCVDEALNGRNGIFRGGRKGPSWYRILGAVEASIVPVRWEYARHCGGGTSPGCREKWAKRKHVVRIIGAMSMQQIELGLGIARLGTRS